MANNWVTLGEDRPTKDELLQLYKLFQDRQIADLDMLHRYANYYVAALLAMLAALAIGITQGYATPVAGALVALPVVSFILAQQGKLMSFRFYRRFNEGRVRLSKIEYLLGLQGPISCKDLPRHDLWPHDEGFLLGRYRREAEKEPTSTAFVRRRSEIKLRGGYGAGHIIQMSFSVFTGLFALALIGLPLGLLFASTSRTCKTVNIVLSLTALLVAAVHTVWYWRVRDRMLRETSDDPSSQQSLPADAEAGVADG